MGDHSDHDDERTGVPAVSRIDRPGTRRYRVLSRTSSGYRVPRQRRRAAIAELLGLLLERHGLTDEMRQRAVCLYWHEIAGERFASKTSPLSFAGSVLHISAISSAWVHEMQFSKAQLIGKIHDWIEMNRVWLGAPPLVTDIRFTLGAQRREQLVDPEHGHRLRLRHLQRARRKRENAPPVVTDADRHVICGETMRVADPELRSVIEAVRLKWNL